MKYIFLGSFTLYGTGYTTIIKNLAFGLVDGGHEVMILATDYDKTVHDLPFKLVPIEYSWSYEALLNIPDDWSADRVIVAMDIPKLAQLAEHFLKTNLPHHLWLLEAIFPVESHPILPVWAERLGMYQNRFVISEYGVDQCLAAGLDAYHLPMGCVVGKRPKDKVEPRKYLNWPQDRTIFLTVSDNHERKALPLAMKAFAELPDNTHYYMLTDSTNKMGWDLMNLAREYDILDRFNIIQYGINRGILSTMYWASDALVVPSLAEGACLPIYEAASHGLPVIGGDWTALSDVADEEWYMALGFDYEYRFPWGNVKRWYPSINDLLGRMLEVIHKNNYDRMVEAALEFANGKSWSSAVEVLESAGDKRKEFVPKQEKQKVSG